MALRVKGFKPNPEGIRALSRSARVESALMSRAEAIREETASRATLSGYRKNLHIVPATGDNGATAYVYTEWPFAHLDEWGGLMYATPSYPMTSAIHALGFRLEARPKGGRR